MKEKIKTTSFWLGVSSSLVIIVESIANLFDVNFSSSFVGDIVLSICSVLVLLGIVTKKNVTDESNVNKEDLLIELKNVDNDDTDENK